MATYDFSANTKEELEAKVERFMPHFTAKGLTVVVGRMFLSEGKFWQWVTVIDPEETSE